MGREIRLVPKNWEHHKSENGSYIPLLQNFSKRLKEWEDEYEMWGNGMRKSYVSDGYVEKKGDELSMSYEEWAGEKPLEADYMPDWPESEKTHFQMYEDTSEGTPISPVMESPEILAKWLADNNASAFGDMTATYEQWLATCKKGYSVGLVIDGNSMVSGVEASI